MEKRWLVYILIGLVFGVFDFYYQIFIHNKFYDQLLGGLGGESCLAHSSSWHLAGANHSHNSA
jgi:uncharacterized membrane protein